VIGTSPSTSYTDLTAGSGSYFYTVEGATTCGTAP